MLRRAIIAAGFVVFMLAGAPGGAQTEFDPDTVELDEDPTAEPSSSDETTEEPQPEAQPDPQPKPKPKPQPDPRPATETESAPETVRPAPGRRATTRSRGRVRRVEVSQVGPAIPAELQPWIAWALHDSPELVCPDVNGTRTCRWPGTLRVQASERGGTFSLDVYADRETEFALPGDREHWPQQVEIDGAAPPVLSQSDVPHVLVPSGSHRITGAFLWSEVPEVISVPPNVGSVDLTLAGRAVAHPRVDAGRLWLRDGNSEGLGEAESDSVRASIYRKFADGVPLTITTRLRLNVSGRAREVELGKVLVAGSRPTAVRAQIPVQVGQDGDTKVYVRPGSHDVEIDAVIGRRVDSVAAPQPTPNFYDPQEVWVWVPDEAVRSVELDGLTAVDPERTSLPSEWGGYTTFLAEPGTGLKLEVTRRGVTEAQPNALSLRRDMWLDLDGTGYTIRDRVNGSLHQGWRLDYTTTGAARLGRVSQNGENLLITQAPGTGLTGVEVRNSAVNLEAEIRVEDARTNLAIVGWDHDVQSLGASLHLPPGWTLLGGEGVDTMEGTWIESWTLWDFFFVLMVAIVVGRLFGWQWAGVTILALCLAHGEQDAPEWIWIHLIASLALLRVLPRGWWRKLVVTYRWGAVVVLAVIMAPFVHDQVMVAFHPQVSAAHPHHATADPGFARGGFVQATQEAPMEMIADAEPADDVISELEFDEEEAAAGAVEQEQKRPQKKMKEKNISLMRDGKDSLWGSYDSQIQVQQLDPNAVVQTGPGLPNWHWSTWQLEWTGPVGKDHTISLWLLSPNLNKLLGLIRVILLLFLALLLIAPRDMYWERRQPVPAWWRRLFGTGLPILLCGLVFAAAQPRALAAEIPDEETLAQLRSRIAEATTCPSPCVVASDASIAVNNLEFEMVADVSAAQDTAWTLPGPADVLRIQSVQVDGVTTNQLRREGGLVQVRLDAGNHEVVVVGTLADRNTVTIQFDEVTRPRHVSYDGAQWAVDGISPTGVPDNSLQLTRTAGRPDAAATSAANTELPPWYQVERHVALGMPWQLETTVRRDDTSRPQLVKIPLLSNEKVITEGIRMEGGFALVDFARGQQEVGFVAEIPIGAKVELRAAQGEPWTESWTVECSRIWRCAFSELPPMTVVRDNNWKPQWKPWPGEALTITVEKPQGAPGEPKTVENVKHTVTPGKRLLQAELTFTIRASQGDWQEVTLPKDAQLQSVSIDGTERSIRPRDQILRLPVQPGETHYVLSWQQPWERGTTERVPSVDIGSAAANVETSINLGGGRWLLAVRNDGMPWGPAVLFWWRLGLVLLLALILGSIPHVPLTWWEWGLIAVGMSQLPIVALLPIVFWFIVMSWRRREPLEEWYKFDALQLGIVLLTLMAVGALYGAAHTNLVLDIDMQVDGYNSTNSSLNWYTDRVDGALPSPAIVSVPDLAFRVVSFLWALWAVLLVVRSARWGWQAFSTDGWWKFPKPRTRPPGGAQPPPHPRESQDEPSEPPPPPVPRNARDGELVHAEYNLGEGQSSVPGSDDFPTVNLGEVDTEPAWGEGEESTSTRSGPIEPPPDEPPHLLGELTTDDVIGALVDDSDILDEQPASSLADDEEDEERSDDGEE